jgi:hypothetical protein
MGKCDAFVCDIWFVGAIDLSVPFLPLFRKHLASSLDE